MSDEEAQIRRMRLSLEGCKELVLKIYSVLLWEKHWHSTAIIGGSTILFMLIWLCDPNVLTIISLLGLLFTVCDYVLPSIVSTLYKNEQWTPNKQKQLEDICTNIVLYKTKTELLLTSFYKMRVSNSKVYFSVTIITLSLLAWIGGSFNNLFLTYMATTFVLLIPGMSSSGMLNKWSDSLQKVFTDLVENAKSKVGQKKVE
ncbi:unnamed protein product [Brassicogethes aeneus]|uniref:Reticulon domain-containing protein n=1 Tax=Brassicogethes aeneus TaxID=1431903 RepID=A0A9P0B3N0_BRAAE|nr:unnamed protein product [Brassicogethes aeneus]